MRRWTKIALLGILVLSTGCIRTLHPFYTEKDIVFEPGLIGAWSEKDSKEVWAFSKGEENNYTLVYTDGDGEQGRFTAHLVKIRGKLFLDFFPRDPELKENKFYKFHLFPFHTFAHVRQIAPELQMSFPQIDWLKKYIADKPGAIRHEKIENEVILTAATKDLQAFWLAHLEAVGAFGDFSNMKRENGNKSPAKGTPEQQKKTAR